MDYGKVLERAMGMGEGTWHRHANPWSFWTRIPILPLLTLAIYARAFIGWWSLFPVAAVVAWTFINPRAFSVPRDWSTWAARGTLGERVWLARGEVAIPQEFRIVANLCSAISAVGGVILVYGLVVLDAWASLAGCAIAVLGKMWFVDRMVWLYDSHGEGRFLPEGVAPVDQPTG